MKREAALIEELCVDEAVCFIARRHNVTPQQLMGFFLLRPSTTDGDDASAAEAERPICLEPNEVEILKGLSGTDRGKVGI